MLPISTDMVSGMGTHAPQITKANFNTITHPNKKPT